MFQESIKNLKAAGLTNAQLKVALNELGNVSLWNYDSHSLGRVMNYPFPISTEQLADEIFSLTKESTPSQVLVAAETFRESKLLFEKLVNILQSNCSKERKISRLSNVYSVQYGKVTIYTLPVCCQIKGYRFSHFFISELLFNDERFEKYIKPLISVCPKEFTQWQQRVFTFK